MAGIEQLMSDIFLGPIKQVEHRRRETKFDELGEIEQQFQIPVSGFAAGTIASASTTVDFDVEFVPSVNQRYSNLIYPQVYVGIEITTGLPMIQAVVTGWTTDDRDVISGATVTVSAVRPGATDAVAYVGVVHISFQGWGAVAEYAGGD
jgi:hypothetical protein